MNAKERMTHFIKGEPLDRLPIYFFHGTVGAKLVGLTYQESEASADQIALKEIESYRRLKMDQVSVNYGLFGLARSFGTPFKTNSSGNYVIDRYLMDCIDQLDQLQLDLFEFDQDASQQKYYRALELIQAEIGQEVDIYFELPGPLTAAASLIEPEKLLKATRKKPEAVHQLLDFVTTCLIQLVQRFSQLDGIGFAMMDPVASGDLISEKQFRSFSLPYTQRVMACIHQYHPFAIIHICGDTTNILNAIADTGVDGISVDQKVDLAKAVDLVGDRVTLIGNVDPVSVILQGDEADLSSHITTCIEKGKQATKGFILAPGCSVPYATSLTNMDTFMRIAAEKAKIK